MNEEVLRVTVPRINYVPPPLDNNRQAIPSLLINAAGDVVPPSGTSSTTSTVSSNGVQYAGRLNAEEARTEMLGDNQQCSICLVDYLPRESISMFRQIVSNN